MYRLIRNSLLGCLAITCCPVAIDGVAAIAGDTYTTPESAPAVFKLQGEYLGVIESWKGTWGAQVVAVSEDKLEIHLLEGGLPGDGAKDRLPSKVLEAKVNSSGDKAEGSGDGISATISSDTLVLRTSSGERLGQLAKMVRESKSLGMKPPTGAVVLFDGSNADSFENGKKNDLGYLLSGCTSKEGYGDHRLHIEFRTPFQPDDKGQARGNSGVYVQGRYEVQVLDSFGLRGEDNECGGIYQIARPKLNMCYPPMSWQTYDIDFVAAKYDAAGNKSENAKVTIKHNGVVIHEDLELPRATPGKDKEGTEPGKLYLQDHGNPVFFRNIWVVPKQEANRRGPRVSAGRGIE